jgi:hypothetical protein
MKLHKWRDVAARHFGAEKLSEVRARAGAELAIEMNLAELGKVLGKTPSEIAEACEGVQAKVGEDGDDDMLSLLRRYVEALGGKLEVSAVFDDNRVLLKV